MRYPSLLLLVLICTVGWGQSITWIGGTGDWNHANNWDCTCIPETTDSVIIDEGTVTIPEGVAVSIEQIVIGFGATLINHDTLTLANPGAEAIVIHGTFSNFGYAIINEAQVSGIMLHGQLINHGEVFIDSVLTEGIIMDGTAPRLENLGIIHITCPPNQFGIFSLNTNASIFNGSGAEILASHSGSNASNIEFYGLIENEGLIQLYEGSFGGIGTLVNDGVVVMNNPSSNPQQGLKLRAIYNHAGASISMQHLSSWAFIGNDSIINHGEILITHTFTDAMNLSGTVLINYGIISMRDIGRFGLLTSTGTVLRNETGALLHIAEARASGLRLERIQMYNNGLIRLDTVGSNLTADADHGIDCVIQGYMFNDTLGEIYIDSCFASGLNLATAFTSVNHGVIHVRHARQNGAALSGNHIFQNTGTLDVDTIQGVGVILSGTSTQFQNSGVLKIGPRMDLTDFSINNSCLFTNDSCGHIYTFNKMRNSGTLMNYGFLKNRSTVAHTFTSGGTTVNEGVISDYNGFIAANANVDNHGIILNAKSSTGCPASTIPGALTLGSNTGFTITGILASNPAHSPVASYDSISNMALLSDLFPETGDWLWVIRHVNTGCQDTLEMKVTTSCPVSCMTGDTTYWTGCQASEDWFSALNWSGGIPTAMSTVVIPYISSRPYPILNTPATIRTMWLRRQSVFTLTAGVNLNIEY